MNKDTLCLTLVAVDERMGQVCLNDSAEFVSAPALVKVHLEKRCPAGAAVPKGMPLGVKEVATEWAAAADSRRHNMYPCIRWPKATILSPKGLCIIVVVGEDGIWGQPYSVLWWVAINPGDNLWIK